jgi:signal transduction histidine kinase
MNSFVIRYFIIIIAFFIFLKSYSISNQANGSKENVEVLINKSKDYLLTNIDSSFNLAEEAARLSKKANDTILLLKSLNAISSVKEAQLLFDEAIQINKEALQLSFIIKDSTLIWEFYNKIGYFYFLKLDYTNALQNYIEALRLSEKINRYVAESNRNIAMIYKSQKDYPKAIEYLEKSLTKWIEEKDSVNISKSLLNISGNLAQIGKYDEALEDLFSAFKYTSAIKDTLLMSDIMVSIANIFILKSDTLRSEEYYNKAVVLKEKIGDRKGLALIYNNMSFFFIKKTDYVKSEKYAKLALEYAKRANLPNVILPSYKSLAFIYAQQKKFDLAYFFQNKFIQLKDSLFSIEKSQQIAEVETKYETEKKAQQIKLLESENLVKETEIKHHKSERNFLVAGIGLLVLLIFFIWKGYQQKKKTNQVLSEKNILIELQKADLDKQNHELNKVNATKDKLFSIIAHDLRSPMNSMEGVSDIIRQLIAAGKLEKLNAVAQHIDQTISRLNLLLENLLGWSLSQVNGLFVKPEILNIRTIALYSANLQKPALEKKQIELNVEIDSSIDARADQNMLRTILRNLISNAIKFTPEQGNIVVGAWHDNQFVYIFVKDSGIGIPPEKINFIFELNERKISTGTDGSKGTGLGLTLCKEFVNLNGGEIKINSQAGKGTEVIFTLPLNNDID